MQEGAQQFFLNTLELLINVQETGQGGHENSLLTSFSTSFFAILVCQTGDKTFFLAMIMAMKYSKFVVFIGSFGALVVMTVLSAVFGKLLFSLIPKIYTDIIVTFLFFYFGVKLLHEAWTSQGQQGSENSELKQVQLELKQMQQNLIRKSQKQLPKYLVSDQISPETKRKYVFTDRVILTQAFIMIFLAEWGDRSQIATVALAASYNLFMVSIGCLLGHFICTGAAVQLGQWISKKVTQKQVQYAGGFVFILSGLTTLIMIFEHQPQQN